jgi:hypothetical protein
MVRYNQTLADTVPKGESYYQVTVNLNSRLLYNAAIEANIAMI